MKKDIIILAVDAGKYENIGVFWNQEETPIHKENFITKFVCKLQILKKAIVAIESPLFIPSGNLNEIAKSRKGVDIVAGMSRPWSMSASFSCGLQFLDIFFSQLPEKTYIFTSVDEFSKAEKGILICEAFISGGGNDFKIRNARKNHINAYYNQHSEKNRHNHDAECAVSLLEKMEQVRELEFNQKYINLPYLLTISSPHLEFCGKRNTGIIVRSPKPCFEPEAKQQEILKIIFNQ